MNSISVCAIMKNEKRHLESFLKAVQKAFLGYTYELVLIDHESTDGSDEIAKKAGAKVYTRVWNKDFAAAKNYAIEKCSYDLILLLDLDEYITQADVSQLFLMEKKHPMDIGMITRVNHLQDGGTTTEQIERIFSKKGFRYKYPVHEQLLPIESDREYSRYGVNVSIDHYGYVTKELLKEKSERNKEILKGMETDNPRDPYVLYQLGKCYDVTGEYSEALSYYRRALAEDVNPELKYVKDLVYDYGNALLSLGENSEALALEGIYSTFAVTPEFVFLMGMIYLKNGLWESAVSEFKKATAYKTASIAGVNSFLAYYHIGCIYEITGKLQEAKEAYEKCGDYVPGKERLRELGV